MTVRRSVSLTTKLAVMVRQAVCPKCGERLGALKDVEFDHSTPLAIGGADDESNLVALHVECHAVKTTGTPATTAGSDIHLIAKGKRLTKDQEETRRRLLAKSGQAEASERPKGKIPSRPFPKRREFR